MPRGHAQENCVVAVAPGSSANMIFRKLDQLQTNSNMNPRWMRRQLFGAVRAVGAVSGVGNVRAVFAVSAACCC